MQIANPIVGDKQFPLNPGIDRNPPEIMGFLGKTD